MRIAWKRSAWIAAGAMLSAAIGSGQAPATQPGSALSAGDAALLKQLESPQWRQRQDATAKLDLLAHRPDAAEPILEAMRAQTTSPEARVRLDAILGRLGGIRMTQESLITLSLKNVPAREAFEELFRQAECPLSAESEAVLAGMKRPVSVEAHNAPFWEVFRTLSAQTGVMLWNEYDERCNPAPQLTRKVALPNGPWSLSGPYLFVATAISYQHDVLLRKSGDGQYESLSLEISGFPEPKIVVLGPPYGNLTVLEATDDHGNSLVPPAPPCAIADDFPFPGQEWDVTADLVLPKHNPGKRLVRFRAVATPTIQGGFQRIEMRDLMHATPRPLKIGDEVIDFAGCRKAGDHFDLTLGLIRDPDKIAPKHIRRITDALRLMRITDDAGHQFYVGSLREVNDGDKVMEILGLYQRDLKKGQPTAEPTHLLWNATTQWRRVDIPIELKDITLDVRPHE